MQSRLNVVVDHGKARMGSYEAWDDVVRSAVVWAGLADFAAADVSDSGRSRIRTDADQDAESLATVLSKLAGQYSRREFTAADVMILVERDPELRHALQAVAGDKHATVTAQSLPYALRSIVRRPAGGLRLDYGAVKRRPRQYVVRDGATIPDDGSNPSRTIWQRELIEGLTNGAATADRSYRIVASYRLIRTANLARKQTRESSCSRTVLRSSPQNASQPCAPSARAGSNGRPREPPHVLDRPGRPVPASA